jgi:hypothetical protein
MNLVRINVVLTGLFVVVTAIAAAVFSPELRVAVAVFDLALFAIGVATFILGYFSAVQRSRYDEISVAGLFLLLDKVADRSTTLKMNTALAVQTIVGLTGAIVRGSTDGKPGSTLAFGVLVPLLGLGLNGMWASKHGVFAPRNVPNVSADESDIGKDGQHG